MQPTEYPEDRVDKSKEPSDLYEETGSGEDDTDNSRFSLPSAKTVFAIGGVLLVVGLILGAVLWLLFAPQPSRNAQEAADIMQAELAETMRNANAYYIPEGQADQTTNRLWVETADETCKVFEINRNTGNYRAFESYSRTVPVLLRWEPFNYTQAFVVDDNRAAFEYYAGSDDLRHGVYVNMGTGVRGLDNSMAVDISGHYDSHRDVSDESHCWVFPDEGDEDEMEDPENA